MFTSLPSGSGRLLAALTIPLLFVSTADAQFGLFGRRNWCDPCAAPVAPAYAAAPVAYTQPMMTASACPCMQPVTEPVYRDVQVTQYKPVKKTVKKPVLRTVYEDRPVTGYKQVMEPRTVNVPTVSYQTVQEMRPVTMNRSYWQTSYQPVCKVSPCQYDPRPGFLGWWNRSAYNMRSAFTPNHIRQRQFVPNVQTAMVPYNRTVAVQGTRQVTYNVAKMVPYQTTQKVARTITEYEDVEVTAYEPYTVTKTVNVGNRVRYAFVDPTGGSTATALEPTPDRTRSANSGNGAIQQNSYEIQARQPAPVTPQYNMTPAQPAQPQAAPAAAEPGLFFNMENGYKSQPRPILGTQQRLTSQQTGGWKASRRRQSVAAKPVNGPKLPAAVAAN